MSTLPDEVLLTIDRIVSKEVNRHFPFKQFENKKRKPKINYAFGSSVNLGRSDNSSSPLKKKGPELSSE